MWPTWIKNIFGFPARDGHLSAVKWVHRFSGLYGWSLAYRIPNSPWDRTKQKQIVSLFTFDNFKPVQKCVLQLVLRIHFILVFLLWCESGSALKKMVPHSQPDIGHISSRVTEFFGNLVVVLPFWQFIGYKRTNRQAKYIYRWEIYLLQEYSPHQNDPPLMLALVFFLSPV